MRSPCSTTGVKPLSSATREKPGWQWRSAAAAAAAAKSLQSCPTLCDPIDGSPPGSPVPGILQARTLEWVAISFSNAWKWKVKVKSLSHVRLLVTPWTAAHQAPPSMGFSIKSIRVCCHCLLHLKTYSVSFPGAQSASFFTLNPLQGVSKVNSCSSTGFNLCRGRCQMSLASANL